MYVIVNRPIKVNRGENKRLTLSKYFGIYSTMNLALAGDISLGFTMTAFPAAMAPAIGSNDNARG